MALYTSGVSLEGLVGFEIKQVLLLMGVTTGGSGGRASLNFHAYY